MFAATFQVLPAGASDVIRDKEWSIKIRPNSRGTRSAELVEQTHRRVTPAVYQGPSLDVAPAPESVQADPAPAKNAGADSPRLDGPQLTPSVPPAPATYSDPATRSVDLVPGVLPRSMTYTEAYASIPFSRTEYEANPMYRHQAAMEVMFQTLRPTTMVQNVTPRAFRYPDSYQIPYPYSGTQNIDIRTFGSGPNYNGQSPFGYPYGLKGNW